MPRPLLPLALFLLWSAPAAAQVRTAADARARALTEAMRVARTSGARVVAAVTEQDPNAPRRPDDEQGRR